MQDASQQSYTDPILNFMGPGFILIILNTGILNRLIIGIMSLCRMLTTVLYRPGPLGFPPPTDH